MRNVLLDSRHILQLINGSFWIKSDDITWESAHGILLSDSTGNLVMLSLLHCTITSAHVNFRWFLVTREHFLRLVVDRLTVGVEVARVNLYFSPLFLFLRCLFLCSLPSPWLRSCQRLLIFQNMLPGSK